MEPPLYIYIYILFFRTDKLLTLFILFIAQYQWNPHCKSVPTNVTSGDVFHSFGYPYDSYPKVICQHWILETPSGQVFIYTLCLQTAIFMMTGVFWLLACYRSHKSLQLPVPMTHSMKIQIFLKASMKSWKKTSHDYMNSKFYIRVKSECNIYLVEAMLINDIIGKHQYIYSHLQCYLCCEINRLCFIA